MKKNIKIGAFVSGGGSNLQAILDSIGKNQINGEVVFVGADNYDAYGLERAKQADIPTFVVDYASIIKTYNENPEKIDLPYDFDYDKIFLKQNFFSKDKEKVKKFLITRAIAEFRLFEEMQSFSFDLLILAGFMRNLTPYFIDKVNTEADKPKIMNIHPAILPAFPGVDGYGDSFRYGCKVGGCTVHFIDYGEDSGPIIGQRAFDIKPYDSLDSIKEKGLKIEWELYPECIQLFALDKLEIVKSLGTQRNIVNIKQ